jgi:DNA-directed RNA polymerase subunit E'/Rpb7
MDELEGSCLGKFGYVISVCGRLNLSFAFIAVFQVLEILDQDIELGLIDNDTGCVNITVWYSAILLRPFPSEVMDAVVTTAGDVSSCMLPFHLYPNLIFINPDRFLLQSWPASDIC